jgi:hypothetical protein
LFLRVGTPRALKRRAISPMLSPSCAYH